jgi:hypothetical protein
MEFINIHLLINLNILFHTVRQMLDCITNFSPVGEL